MKKVREPATATVKIRLVFMEPPARRGFNTPQRFFKTNSMLCEYTAGVVNRLQWIFANERRRLRAGWRVVIFIAAYILGGKGLDAVFTKFGLPGGFTWQGILSYEMSDFALVCAVAWMLSRIEGERFSSYGLPLTRDAG